MVHSMHFITYFQGTFRGFVVFVCFFFGLRHKDVTTDCLPKQASFVSKYTLVVTMKFVSRKWATCMYTILHMCIHARACVHAHMYT